MDDTPPNIDACESLDLMAECNGNLEDQLVDWHNRNLLILKSCAVESCGSIKVDSDFDLANIESSCANSGTLRVTYEIKDDCDNKVEFVANAIIEDITPPTIICQDIELQLINPDSLELNPQIIDQGSFDNCGEVKLDIILNELLELECGINTEAKLVGTDECGNSDTCNFMIKPLCFDLALKKELVDDRNYSSGDTASFRIMVINQGDIIAQNVVIVDYLPDGLEIVSTRWIEELDYFTYQIPNVLEPGDTFNLELKTIVNPVGVRLPIVNVGRDS